MLLKMTELWFILRSLIMNFMVMVLKNFPLSGIQINFSIEQVFYENSHSMISKTYYSLFSGQLRKVLFEICKNNIQNSPIYGFTVFKFTFQYIMDIIYMYWPLCP